MRRIKCVFASICVLLSARALGRPLMPACCDGTMVPASRPAGHRDIRTNYNEANGDVRCA